jgi:hypothetical protein
VQVFWARHQELPDWEKVIKNIERGEQKIQRQADIMQAVRSKLERYKNPWQELKVCIDTCVCKTIRQWTTGLSQPGGREGGGWLLQRAQLKHSVHTALTVAWVEVHQQLAERGQSCI